MAGNKSSDRPGEETDAEAGEGRDLRDAGFRGREEQSAEHECGGGAVDGVFVQFDDGADRAGDQAFAPDLFQCPAPLLLWSCCIPFEAKQQADTWLDPGTPCDGRPLWRKGRSPTIGFVTGGE